MARIVAVCVGGAKGAPKRPVGQAQLVKNFGLSGDADTGPDARQVTLLDRAGYPARGEANPPPRPGAFGENLLLDGLDLASLAPGTTLRAGDALLVLYGRIPGGPLYGARVRLAGIVTEGEQIVVETPAGSASG
jgi:hypothetical protein